MDRNGRENVTTHIEKGIKVFELLPFDQIRQYFHNHSACIEGCDLINTVLNKQVPNRLAVLYSALSSFQMEETVERIHS